MGRRRLLATGLGIAMLAAPVAAGVVTATPASAATVVDGCTIVANPTPTNFTNCPGANLSSANLSNVNLSFANLAGARFVDCFLVDGVIPSCVNASLAGADLAHADLSNAALAACVVPFFPAALQCGRVDLSGANLSGAALTGATLENCPLGPFFCSSPILTGADLSGTIFVPANQTVPATSGTGAVATFVIPAPLTTAAPTRCSPPSGSTFPIGTTTVTCAVFDDPTVSSPQGNEATGTFTVTVQGAAEQLASLLATVTNLGPGTSLADKVQEAQAAVSAGQPAQAAADLKDLTSEVRAQSGKTVTPAQVTTIVAAASRIVAVLST